MEESSHGINNLLAAREVLRTSIERSRNMAIAVDQTGSRLTATRHNLAHLRAGIEDMACTCAVYEIRDHVDRAIGPAAAVPNVLELVYELQDSLNANPRAGGLFTYIANIKRLQDALKLLADNCRLVMLWMEDVVQILKSSAATAAADDDDDRFLVGVAKVLKVLLEVLSFCEDEGFCSAAFRNLENEYRCVLTETDLSLERDSSTFPPAIILDLQGMTEAMAGQNRLERCISIYAEARTARARAILRARVVDYLDIQLSEVDSVQNVGAYIYQWDKDMEFVVSNLLQQEYKLCSEFYHKFGSDVSMNCFAKIATQCGFLEIFEFGISVCKCKKDAIKLLSLLKIFSTLDRLRLEFNQLFDGKFCVKIQNQTRALVKSVVDNACEVFWELLAQVEMQRGSNPPLDGDVPRLVRFVTEYCNRLLEDENRSILTRILEIHQVWNGLSFEDGLLSNEIRSIMKAVEINLETWAQSYKNTSLSYLFMMNSHWYLCNGTRGTKLGELMGKSWTWAYEESTEYYAGLYMRESWETLLVFLREDGLILFPGGRAVDRDLVKKRTAGFSEAFDKMYRKQSKWRLCDNALRLKMCRVITEAIVPPYKRYLQRFTQGLEYDKNQVKYSEESLRSSIGCLFEHKIGTYGGSRCTELIGVKNAARCGVMNRNFPSTPAAA